MQVAPISLLKLALSNNLNILQYIQQRNIQQLEPSVCTVSEGVITASNANLFVWTICTGSLRNPFGFFSNLFCWKMPWWKQIKKLLKPRKLILHRLYEVVDDKVRCLYCTILSLQVQSLFLIKVQKYYKKQVLLMNITKALNEMRSSSQTQRRLIVRDCTHL